VIRQVFLALKFSSGRYIELFQDLLGHRYCNVLVDEEKKNTEILLTKTYENSQEISLHNALHRDSGDMNPA